MPQVKEDVVVEGVVEGAEAEEDMVEVTVDGWGQRGPG